MEKFMKKIIRIFHQCFDKVRVKYNVDKEITNIFDKRRFLRSKTERSKALKGIAGICNDLSLTALN